MFTVCPKCALTLVVSAADLRVAQGFVRCGRCSNVFNALARLSEDRNVAANAGRPPAAAPSPEATPTPAPQPSSQPSPPSPPSSPSSAQQSPESSAAPPPSDSQTDAIPEAALEFNPEATDVTKLFVEQTPNPEWSAATGKFKALSRQAQAVAA